MKSVKKKSSYNQIVPRPRCPRGFRFVVEVTKYNTYVKLYTKGVDHSIGHISLQKLPERNGQKWFATHSHLRPEYHNKGLGALMYAKACQWCIDRGHRVRSSGSSSAMAQQMWRGKKIRQYFKVVERTNKYGGATWFVYPRA